MTIYIFCITLLLFSNYVGAEMRNVLGFFLIVICFVYFVINMIIIAVYSLHLLWVYLKRIYVQCRRKHLRNEVIKTVKMLNNERRLRKHWSSASKVESERNWFESQKVKFEPKDSTTGGYKAEPVYSIKLAQKNTDLDEQNDYGESCEWFNNENRLEDCSKEASIA